MDEINPNIGVNISVNTGVKMWTNIKAHVINCYNMGANFG